MLVRFYMMRYLVATRLHLYTVLAYRGNLVLSRFRNIVLLCLLYAVWHEVSKSSLFSLYTESMIMTYLVGAHVLRAMILDISLSGVSQDIHTGGFSSYLVKPLDHLGMWYARSWGDRIINTLSACLEIGVFLWIINIPLTFPTRGSSYVLVSLMLVLAHVLYFLMSYLVGLFAFWSRESGGPRFLFEWFVQCTSGVLFPLSLVSGWIGEMLIYLPFSSLVYVPIQVFLGTLSISETIVVLSMQCVWIVVTFVGIAIVWKRGLRRYTGDGI